MAAASLGNVEIATAAVPVAAPAAGDDKNNSCSGHGNQHTYHRQKHEQPKKRNIYHQTTNCHYHTGASIQFWLAVILVLGELKTGKFIFTIFLLLCICMVRIMTWVWRGILCVYDVYGERKYIYLSHDFSESVFCARRRCHQKIFFNARMHKTVRAAQKCTK